MNKNTKKSKQKLPPTLIIGLGGIGCRIISKVDSKCSPLQREFIRFVYFDTDANELRQRRQEAPHIKVIQTSKPITVGQALRHDTNARENWFPKNKQLYHKSLTEGAGQVRAISKLAFDACVREGNLTPLHDAIDELHRISGDDMEQSMRVIIVSTLVGGTGSGILLPVATYVRNYLETRCQIKSALIRGFCVLPDVFFVGTNKSAVEMNNLRANAYATLRELNAFVQKADGLTTGKGYDFTLEFPRPGTMDEYEELNVSPMDYCFLFDSRNINGGTLCSFGDYLNHAADCIYAQSISVMNTRQNSSEDNTILDRCREDGQNFYCGAGVSRLIYPYNRVRDYIAYNWMDQALSHDWLQFDDEINRKVAEENKKRASGAASSEIDRHELYVSLVEERAKQEKNFPFAAQIYRVSHTYGDERGLTAGNNKCEEYYKNLIKYIRNTATDNQRSLEEVMDDLEVSLSTMDKAKTDSKEKVFGDKFKIFATTAKTAERLARQVAEKSANVIADTLFFSERIAASEDYQIARWLKSEDEDSYLHPNAVRYFLYSLESLIKKQLIALQADTTDGEYEDKYDEESNGKNFSQVDSYLRSFFANRTYPIYKGGEGNASGTIEDSADSLVNQVIGGADQKSIIEKIYTDSKNFKKNLEEYGILAVKTAVLKKALEYIAKMSKAYEAFFNQIKLELGQIPQRIINIIDNSKNHQGSPAEYICASEKCLEAFLEACPTTVDPIKLTPEFRKTVFTKLFEYMNLEDYDMNRHIGDMFDTDILTCWRSSLESEYSKVIDLDIIDAMFKEARYEEGTIDTDKAVYYVAAKIKEAKRLSAPFVEGGKGIELRTIESCALNSEVAETDDAVKSAIIRNELQDTVTDSVLDKREMLFYQAVCNLKATYFQKFAPQDMCDTDPQKSGSYYVAYMNRINNVIPDSLATHVLTPHLDKRWHWVGRMPDLDDANGDKLVNEAVFAFFAGLTYDKIRFVNHSYKVDDGRGGYIDDMLIVSDGLTCDKLHEIYDAMLINRPLTVSMLDSYNKSVDKEIAAGLASKGYKSSKIYKKFAPEIAGGNSTPELELEPKFSVMKRPSFFEIPYLYKLSMIGNPAYSDRKTKQMLFAIIEFIEKYVERFCDDDYRKKKILAEWFYEQQEIFRDHLINNYSDVVSGDADTQTAAEVTLNDSFIVEAKNIIASYIQNECDDEETAAKIRAEWK